MRYLWQHIEQIIREYKGDIPLTHYLKRYFKQWPKLGSRDRRLLTAMSYSWYRCAKGISPAWDGKSETIQKMVMYALQLCQTAPELLGKLSNEGQNISGLSFDIEQLIGMDYVLTEGVERNEWLTSMLRQPQLFIRSRKGRHSAIVKRLEENDINYSVVSEHCLALPNGSAVDKVLPADWYAVQDASSQATGNYFDVRDGERWMDCCSGAGGKSLLLSDMGKKIHLTVSDRRSSILRNLQERFALYGLKQPDMIEVDMSDAGAVEAAYKGKKFDRMICDVPCSGSGTWARTPEQLYFFEYKQVEAYHKLQLAIAQNAAGLLERGGKMVYITCSVFARENEDVVHELAKSTGLEVLQRETINGIAMQADCMYAAVLLKK